MDSSPAAKPKTPNSFQIIGRLFSASIGIASKKNRGRELMEASTLAWLGAVVIFVGAHYVAIRIFVYLIRRSAGQL